MMMVYHATKVDQERALVQQISLFCDVPRALAAFAFSVAAMSSAVFPAASCLSTSAPSSGLIAMHLSAATPFRPSRVRLSSGRCRHTGQSTLETRSAFLCG